MDALYQQMEKIIVKKNNKKPNLQLPFVPGHLKGAVNLTHRTAGNSPTMRRILLMAQN